MKTPSFIELKSLVEYLSEELAGAQLQEVIATEEGLVLTFYRFTKTPRTAYLVFDLDKPFPFIGLFTQNPWAALKKTKPVGLFLNANAKNSFLNSIELVESLGRVLRMSLGKGAELCKVEVRLIPKQPNFIVSKAKKTISWYPVQELAENDPTYLTKADEEMRSIPYLMNQWAERRSATGKQKSMGAASSLSPFEKWKKNRERDIEKKTKALDGIQLQVEKFQQEPWAEVGEFLKNEGLKNVKPEWTPYINFTKTVSQNMQNCFDKAKTAKTKILGARKRAEFIKEELRALEDLSDARFQSFLLKQNNVKNKIPVRKIEGRFRKQTSESGIVAYMGKSAADNIDLLRKSKAWDLWLHLKDYPSAHAIIFRQKDQSVSDKEISNFAAWLVKEGLGDKKSQMGGKFAVVIVECRHVKPLKGDKLGRVTYHNAREILIAI
ncbi:MAG: hypothetical protein H7061_03825 [Bdellovibrionaceae bacterium]|nr:hypothetical protein [Bdellovibrio sp.]